MECRLASYLQTKIQNYQKYIYNLFTFLHWANLNFTFSHEILPCLLSVVGRIAQMALSRLMAAVRSILLLFLERTIVDVDQFLSMELGRIPDD